MKKQRIVCELEYTLNTFLGDIKDKTQADELKESLVANLMDAGFKLNLE